MYHFEILILAKFFFENDTDVRQNCDIIDDEPITIASTSKIKPVFDSVKDFSSVNVNLATIPEDYDIDTFNIINNGPVSTASQNKILDSRDGLNSPESGRHQSHHCTQPSTPSIGLLDRFKRRSSEIFKTNLSSTSNGTSRDESPWNLIKNKTRPVLKYG